MVLLQAHVKQKSDPMPDVEKAKANIIHHGTYWFSDSDDIVVFQVDDDWYKYLIMRAMLVEAPRKARKTGRGLLNYIKTCPGRCKKNGVEINHLGSLDNNNDEVTDE